MERGSAKHSPRLDETLDREDHDLTQGSPNPHIGPVVEEVPAEDELPIGTDPRVEDPTLAPPESALEDRATLATFVRPGELPATGVELAATAEELGAPADVIARFHQLPEGRIYETFQEIWDDVNDGELPPNV